MSFYSDTVDVDVDVDVVGSAPFPTAEVLEKRGPNGSTREWNEWLYGEWREGEEILEMINDAPFGRRSAGVREKCHNHDRLDSSRLYSTSPVLSLPGGVHVFAFRSSVDGRR